MHGPTRAQVRAVFEVMRILREDDRSRGLHPAAQVHCTTCNRDRPAAGAIRYDGSLLCNGCATDYELLRIARLTPPR